MSWRLPARFFQVLGASDACVPDRISIKSADGSRCVRTFYVDDADGNEVEVIALA